MTSPEPKVFWMAVSSLWVKPVRMSWPGDEVMRRRSSAMETRTVPLMLATVTFEQALRSESAEPAAKSGHRSLRVEFSEAAVSADSSGSRPMARAAPRWRAAMASRPEPAPTSTMTFPETCEVSRAIKASWVQGCSPVPQARPGLWMSRKRLSGVG